MKNFSNAATTEQPARADGNRAKIQLAELSEMVDAGWENDRIREALGAIVDEVRVRASATEWTLDGPESPTSGVRIKSARGDGLAATRVMSLDEAREVIDAIRREDAARGTVADMQRALA